MLSQAITLVIPFSFSWDSSDLAVVEAITKGVTEVAKYDAGEPLMQQ